jgi:protein-tyrosine-phosphatase
MTIPSEEIARSPAAERMRRHRERRRDGLRCSTAGSPMNTGTMCVGLRITGSAEAVRTALVRAARS